MATNKGTARTSSAKSTDPGMATAQESGDYTGLAGSETVDAGNTGEKDAGSYTVKDGDSLESIAAENDTTTAELVSLNPDLAGNGNNFVYTGQTIRLK